MKKQAQNRSPARTPPNETVAPPEGERLYGREKERLIHPLASANLALHGARRAHIQCVNTLTEVEDQDGRLFKIKQEAPTDEGFPEQFDVVLTNPPFGGKEGKRTRNRFALPSGATQILFLQHIIRALKPGGRCGMVIDEGVLFRTNDTAFVRVREMLLETCRVWAVVSPPMGAFAHAGAAVKTSLLFFTKGAPTESIWYYDLSEVKAGRKTPLTLEKHFKHFFQVLPHFADSPHSWSAPPPPAATGRRLTAENPHRRPTPNGPTLDELLRRLEAHHAAVGAKLEEFVAVHRRRANR